MTLSSVTRPYFDTAPMVYSIEVHPTYSPVLAPLWLSVRAGTARVVTSDLSRLEALVGALRRGDGSSEATYRALKGYGGIEVVPVAEAVIERAAELRAARTSLKVPDAIHVATAELAGCDAFVTNDKSLRSVPLIPVVMLNDLV